MEHKFDKLDRALVRKDSTVPPGSSAAIARVCVVWRGIPPSVDGVIGVFIDTASAIRLSDDGSTHVTQVMMETGVIGSDRLCGFVTVRIILRHFPLARRLVITRQLAAAE